MRKKMWCTLITLFLFPVFTGSAKAEPWQLAGKKLKIEQMATTDAGLEFKVKGNVAVAPASSCVNWFIVPRGHADFNVLTSFLLTASAAKKKIDFVFDYGSQECMVPVDSIILY
jgi:hypothetical protein